MTWESLSGDGAERACSRMQQDVASTARMARPPHMAPATFTRGADADADAGEATGVADTLMFTDPPALDAVPSTPTRPTAPAHPSSVGGGSSAASPPATADDVRALLRRIEPALHLLQPEERARVRCATYAPQSACARALAAHPDVSAAALVLVGLLAALVLASPRPGRRLPCAPPYRRAAAPPPTAGLAINRLLGALGPGSLDAPTRR
jgi:hypothetical protein